MTRHIRNYATVRRMIDDHYRSEIEEAGAKIAELERKDLPTGDRWNDDRRELERLRGLVERPKQLKNGKLKWPKCSYHTWWKRDRDRLDAADRAGVVTEITFKIEWKKSRTWGMCPSCETWVCYDGEPQDAVPGTSEKACVHHNPRTYASGCGYDKRSTVMSEGIQCPAVDRLVIEHKECWKHYAVEDKTSLPVLRFGGKGPETLRALFKAWGEPAPIPGFEWEWDEGRTWDFIRIRRKK